MQTLFDIELENGRRFTVNNNHPMYVVEEGRLRIYRQRNGAREDLEYLRKGDFFAEFSVLHGEPRTASVEAVTECRLLALAPELFQELLTTYPEFLQRVEERASQRQFRQVARIPLDFAEELLPAEVEAVEKVGPLQVQAEAALPEAAAEPFDEAAEAAPRPGRRRRPPHVYQLDEMDCGAACLAMVTRYFGKAVSLPWIRELVHTSTDGTSLLGIARGAEELGLAVRTVRASKSKLDRLPLPSVVHWEGNHWVVLYDVDGRTVRVGDPARGVRKLPRKEFLEKWTGYAALLDRTPAFESVAESKPSYAWLKPYLVPHWRTLATATVLALIAAGLELTIPIFTQKVIDDAIPHGDRQLLLTMFIGLLAVFGVIIATTIAQGYLLSRAAVRIDTQALDFLTGRLLSLPMAYFTTRRTGDIERRLAGMRQIREFLVQSGVAALTAVQIRGRLHQRPPFDGVGVGAIR